MKTTPFTDVHIALGAKMHEFAGFNMPIEYTGIIDEHMTVVNGVGVFDVSHMGEFWVKGPNALAFIQSVTSNDASVLPIGKAQYTCFPNDKGGIVDDLLVYHYEPEKYLLVVNAGNIAKDWDWCVSHNTVGAELENSSDRTAQLAVQGPKAVEVLQRLTPVDLSSIPYYSFVTGEFAGCKNVIISNTGYTGAGGFELYFYPDDAMTIWNAIFEAGKPEGIKPIGLGARDTLRLEMGELESDRLIVLLPGGRFELHTQLVELDREELDRHIPVKRFGIRPALDTVLIRHLLIDTEKGIQFIVIDMTVLESAGIHVSLD